MKREDRITIDDAGGGNLVGGIVIASFHHRTEKVLHEIIGPEYFEEGCDRILKEHIAQVTQRLVERQRALHLPIHLCRSDLFDAAAAFLTSNGRAVSRGDVEDGAGVHAEDIFFKHLLSLGLPPYLMRLRQLIRKDKQKGYGALNRFSTNFVLCNLSERYSLCKKHSALWKRIQTAEIKTEEYELHHRAKGHHPLCQNCGRRIMGKTAIKYRINQKDFFYIHRQCFLDHEGPRPSLGEIS